MNLEKLPKNWQEKILDMYAAGASDIEVQSEFKIHPATWKELLAQTEFFNIIQLGRQYMKSWWYKQGRVNLKEKDFNSNLWYRNMQNRFGWSDKSSTHDSEEDFTETLSEEQIESKIDEYQKRLKAVS